MKLVLADGTTFEGSSFGAARSVAGEVVFNTGMTGYVETLTDPSYRGQILVLTYPLQGNYGVPSGPFESEGIQVQGLVVSSHTERPSHFASVRSLADWLRAAGVPALYGVDTRRLTRLLREHGTMEGMLLVGDNGARADEALTEATERSRMAERPDSVNMTTVVEAVTRKETIEYKGGDLRILVIDTGAKESILRALHGRGATLVRAPFHSRWESLLKDVDGVVLPNGPGDPMNLLPLAERVRAVLAKGIPTFGICMGHQVLALAAGAKTYKLRYGHRSQNQPVQDIATGRAFVTSQNHGYAVDEGALGPDWKPSFVNLNDRTNEGLRHRQGPFFSVQFHPEAAAGPTDTAFLFDDFLRLVAEGRLVRRGGQKELRVSGLST